MHAFPVAALTQVVVHTLQALVASARDLALTAVTSHATMDLLLTTRGFDRGGPDKETEEIVGEHLLGRGQLVRGAQDDEILLIVQPQDAEIGMAHQGFHALFQRLVAGVGVQVEAPDRLLRLDVQFHLGGHFLR